MLVYFVFCMQVDDSPLLVKCILGQKAKRHAAIVCVINYKVYVFFLKKSVGKIIVHILLCSFIASDTLLSLT